VTVAAAAASPALISVPLLVTALVGVATLLVAGHTLWMRAHYDLHKIQLAPESVPILGAFFVCLCAVCAGCSSLPVCAACLLSPHTLPPFTITTKQPRQRQRPKP
jgi:hypothetical protein